MPSDGRKPCRPRRPKAINALSWMDAEGIRLRETTAADKPPWNFSMSKRTRNEEEARLERMNRLEVMRKVQAEMVETLNAKVEEHGLSPSELYWILASAMANLASADLNEAITEGD